MRFPNASFNQQIRRFFYAVSPYESSFEKTEHVPDYLNEAIPLFMTAILIEYAIAVIKGKHTLRFNDGMSSVGAGLMSQVSKIMILVSELALYSYVYENYRIASLPWNSPWTWIFCFVVVDFIYYWFHRATHEVNVLWGAHQVHHSSEDYNLSTALRQSVVQNYTAWVFYLPMALLAPPSTYYVHHQLNTLYQFWIHTEIVENLGPLEFILNTPSHHRVHHGRNPYCIDKNYGGTLIIWDRIFGTFQAEKDEKVIYGLVHPLNSWQPIYIQLCHYRYMYNAFWEMEGWSNKLSLILKGPGWVPGSPRLGYPEDIPKIEHPVERYNRTLSLGSSMYLVVHSVPILTSFQELAVKKHILQIPHIWAYGCFFVLTMTSVGAMFERKPYAAHLEMLRCLSFVIVDLVASSLNYDIAVIPENALQIVRSVYILSALGWMVIMWRGNEKQKTT